MAGFKEYAIAHKLSEWKMAEPGIEPLVLARALVAAGVEDFTDLESMVLKACKAFDGLGPSERK